MFPIRKKNISFELSEKQNSTGRYKIFNETINSKRIKR